MNNMQQKDDDFSADEQAITLTVDKAGAGMRLDAFCAGALRLTRSAVARLIEDGAITLAGTLSAKRTPLKEGQTIVYIIPAPAPSEVLPQDIPLSIVYEDKDLLVIDKPAGMVVHPAPGNFENTLVNALLYHCGDSLSGIGGVLRPGIVHRIDKDTSGLLVVAKNDEAHRGLSAQLEGHRIDREYQALVNGGFSVDEGTVDLPIGRHPTDRKRMAVVREGHTRPAVTHYRVLERYGAVSHLSLKLETGRTHQIRVHMSALGHPLLGDTVYGGGRTAFERHHAAYLQGQCLHAFALTFTHPRTGEAMRFQSPLPADFTALLTILQRQAT